MTNPNTPDGVIAQSAQRIAAARQATRDLAAEVRARKAAETGDQAPQTDVEPGRP